MQTRLSFHTTACDRLSEFDLAHAVCMLCAHPYRRCRPASGLYDLTGDERIFHFGAMFDAGDVSRDGKLDVVELRHLLNPHLTKNMPLQLAALNMTIANELCAVDAPASCGLQCC